MKGLCVDWVYLCEHNLQKDIRTFNDIYHIRVKENGNKSFPLPIWLTYILIRVPLVEQHRHHPLVDLPVEVLSHLCFQNKYKKMKIYILQDLISFIILYHF